MNFINQTQQPAWQCPYGAPNVNSGEVESKASGMPSARITSFPDRARHAT